MQLHTLKYNPAKGYDEFAVVGSFPFEPTEHGNTEEAAKAFYEALKKFAVDHGYHENSVSCYPPEKSYECGWGHYWTVTWEDGPYNWAIYMSSHMHGARWYVEPYYSFNLCFTEK